MILSLFYGKWFRSNVSKKLDNPWSINRDFTVSFKKTKVVNSSIDILLCFEEKIFPAMLNIRSQAEELNIRSQLEHLNICWRFSLSLANDFAIFPKF